MSYRQTGDWSWEFYPPPYDFLAPRNSAPMLPPVVRRPAGGLGGCGCGCNGEKPGGCSGGLGLFDSGLDWMSWGVAEWGVVAVGAYLTLKVAGDLLRAGSKVKRAYRKRKYRSQRRRELVEELSSL